MSLTLLFLGICGGFLSGLLGVGGAIIMIPLLLTIPKLTGVGALSMQTVTALSMIQVLASSLTGALRHRKHSHIDHHLLLQLGLPASLGSISGALASGHFTNMALGMIFAVIIVMSGVLLFMNDTSHDDEKEKRIIPAVATILIGFVIGVMSGLVGSGGGFMLVPIMTVVYRTKMKVAIGTSLGIVVISAIFGSLGKILAIPIDPLLAIPLVLGSIPAAYIGANVNKHLHPKTLKSLLMITVLVSAILTLKKLI